MLRKIGILLLISAIIAIVETALIYFSRTSGPLPFKIKFQPDIEL